MIYLQDRGLANFDDLRIRVAPSHYRKRCPVTGEITTHKIDDGSPTHAV